MMSKVLGIDPGFDRLGLAVLEGNSSRPTYIWSDCLEIPQGTREERLSYVFQAVTDAITFHKPDFASVESLFFSTNKKTALGVAEARGAVLSALGILHIRATEHTPMQVKVAVTGYGGADKKAVENMVEKLISLPVKRRRDDEYDAIAVAITGLSTSR